MKTWREKGWTEGKGKLGLNTTKTQKEKGWIEGKWKHGEGGDWVEGESKREGRRVEGK